MRQRLASRFDGATNVKFISEKKHVWGFSIEGTTGLFLKGYIHRNMASRAQGLLSISMVGTGGFESFSIGGCGRLNMEQNTDEARRSNATCTLKPLVRAQRITSPSSNQSETKEVDVEVLLKSKPTSEPTSERTSEPTAEPDSDMMAIIH
jgi:hypothetical protein